MPKNSIPSRAQVIRQALEQANQPLSFDQLLAAARQTLPLDARGLKAGLDAAAHSYDAEARLIQRVAEDRYGWLPRLAIGAVLRHTLTNDELRKQRLVFEPEIMTALWPAGIHFRQTEVLNCQIPEGESLTLTVEKVGQNVWHPICGTGAEPAFWKWIRKEGARAQDALVFQTIAGANPSCRVTLEPAAARDEARVQARNTVVAQAAYGIVKTHRRGSRLDDIVARMIAQGLYHDPCPPDSLESIVNGDARFMWEFGFVKVATRYDHLYQELGLAEPDVFELFETAPKAPPRKRMNRKTLAGRVYRFKAAYRNSETVWRRIEIRGDQNLRDLDREMRAAFGHDSSDHLSEFYLGVDAHADRRGLGTHNPFERGPADELMIGELGLIPGDELSYTYDFGDNIQHVLALEEITTPESGNKYPRVSEQNKPRYRYCASCRRKGKKEIAIWICIDCSNEKQKEILVCEEHCAGDHEEHYTQEIVY